MFIATYRFNVHPGKNPDFESAWKEVTQLIYQNCGSLGSRLYKASENSYIGIAQWPNKETWQSADLTNFDPEGWRAKNEILLHIHRTSGRTGIDP